MKPKRPELFVILASAFFAIGAVDCAGLDSVQNHVISIQEIMEQWTAVERAFIEEQVLAEKTHGGGGVILTLKKLMR
jgi:hypothetical protein